MKYPTAYLITFTTYGTWLHGDKRGSVDKEHNRYGTAFVARNAGLSGKEQDALKNPPVTLNQSQTEAVLISTLDVCKFEGWLAHAVHVRSNHAHIVVGGGKKPENMLVKFKRYATRALRNIDSKNIIKNYWTGHGSTRYLWTKESLASAIEYVKNGQGDVMAFGATQINRAPNVSEG